MSAVILALTSEHLDVVLHAAGLTLVLIAGLQGDGRGRAGGEGECERNRVGSQLLYQTFLKHFDSIIIGTFLQGSRNSHLSAHFFQYAQITKSKRLH